MRATLIALLNMGGLRKKLNTPGGISPFSSAVTTEYKLPFLIFLIAPFPITTVMNSLSNNDSVSALSANFTILITFEGQPKWQGKAEI
jgi:hypothetical protein